MKHIYIASPYTKGDLVENVRVSLHVGKTLTLAGYIPFCPLLYHFWHFMDPMPYEFWTRLDLEWVKRCDLMLRLPGDSAGADAEVELAKSLNIPVVYSVAELFDKYGT